MTTWLKKTKIKGNKILIIYIDFNKFKVLVKFLQINKSLLGRHFYFNLWVKSMFTGTMI
jgi:hypothetical protein